jgi:predicted NAD/FAD-dependent oxidoreductase
MPAAPPPVVVVGAGLAGLVAARWLSRSGVRVVLLESTERAGGRVATDSVEGFRIDRGFQVLSTGYPEVPRSLDLARLDLRPFVPGALVRTESGRHLVADPRRRPSTLASTLRAPVGSLGDKARLGWATARLVTSARGARSGPEVTTLRRWQDRGLSPQMLETFLRPFLAGVVLDRDLGVSSRFGDLVWRSFARGTVAVPGLGMAAIADQLAADLPTGVLQLGRRVLSVDARTVRTDDEVIEASAVIVAADPTTAAALVGEPAPAMRPVTTVYHAVDRPPIDEPVLLLDGTGRTPVVNSVVLTNAAPKYSADGRALVATSLLGVAPVDHGALLDQLSWLYDVDASRWPVVAEVAVPHALPAYPPPSPLRRPARLASGLFVAGDWRDTPSIQGALVSGRRVAEAAQAALELRD